MPANQSDRAIVPTHPGPEAWYMIAGQHGCPEGTRNGLETPADTFRVRN
jgi:hypothetical protein